MSSEMSKSAASAATAALHQLSGAESELTGLKVRSAHHLGGTTHGTIGFTHLQASQQALDSASAAIQRAIAAISQLKDPPSHDR